MRIPQRGNRRKTIPAKMKIDWGGTFLLLLFEAKKKLLTPLRAISRTFRI